MKRFFAQGFVPYFCFCGGPPAVLCDAASRSLTWYFQAALGDESIRLVDYNFAMISIVYTPDSLVAL